jgi:hypothetical protein
LKDVLRRLGHSRFSSLLLGKGALLGLLKRLRRPHGLRELDESTSMSQVLLWLKVVHEIFSLEPIV